MCIVDFLLLLLFLLVTVQHASTSTSSFVMRTTTFNFPAFNSHHRVVETLRHTTQSRLLQASVVVDVDGIDDDSLLSLLSEKEEERRLRFRGVGRLYTNTIHDTDNPNANATVKLENSNNDVGANTNNDTSAKILNIESSASSAAAVPAYVQILDRLEHSHVVVVGVGGVGSWAVEALCRSGIGAITLIDLDDICLSNTNRQLHTLASTIGHLKIDTMQHRLHEINPDCTVSLIHDFVTKQNVDEIWTTIETLSSSSAAASSSVSSIQQIATQTIISAPTTLTTKVIPNVTVCLDAIDGSDAKTAWIASCARRKIPIVTCGGSAGRSDPTKFVINDLTRVVEDPLLSSCRKNLRKYYGYPKVLRDSDDDTHTNNTKKKKNRMKLPRKWKIACVYSTEKPKSDNTATSSAASFRGRCDGAMGTACFVTGTSGFVAAGKVVDMIATNTFSIPKQFTGNQLRTTTWFGDNGLD